MVTYLHGQNPGSRVKTVTFCQDLLSVHNELRGLRELVMTPLSHRVLLRFGDTVQESVCVSYAHLCPCRLSKGAAET